MNKQYVAETQRELSQWPGASMTQESQGKHGRIILHYKDESRIVIVSNTPSDARAIKNHIGIVRRELREMGASKNRIAVSGIQRERNKPIRIAMPSEKAPVQENPFNSLGDITMNTIDAIFANIEKLRYSEMLEFAEMMRDAATENRLCRTDVGGWAKTIQYALECHRGGQNA